MNRTFKFDVISNLIGNKDQFHYMGDSDAILKLIPFNTRTIDNLPIQNIISGLLKITGDQSYNIDIENENVLEKIIKTTQELLNGFDLSELQRLIHGIYFPNGQIDDNNFFLLQFLKKDKFFSYSKFLFNIIFNDDSELVKKIFDGNDMNVLDQLLNKAIEKTFNKNINESIEEQKYKKVSTVLDDVIKQDFEFLVSNKSISSDELKLFLQYYMFMYMTQSILILQNKKIGKRDEMIKLYFCLSWEEVSKTRLCYEHGYRSIDAALNALYPNITKCQFLNSTDSKDEQYDFIDFYSHFDEFDNEPSKKELINIILWLREKSQTYIFDEADEGCDVKLYDLNLDELINTLFAMIDRSFYRNSSRSEANIKFKNNYSKMFSSMEFLKLHGSLGYIYNVNEKTLLFFLKIIMKDREIMNLNEFILELEKRGIFMDEKSHDLIANYFDKLNLLEKKSDSGDAKYVKKLL